MFSEELDVRDEVEFEAQRILVRKKRRASVLHPELMPVVLQSRHICRHCWNVPERLHAVSDARLGNAREYLRDCTVIELLSRPAARMNDRKGIFGKFLVIFGPVEPGARTGILGGDH